MHRFVFEHYPIRGHLVHLDAAWRALIEHREYPRAFATCLGEAVAASLLLAATIKFDGVLSLQLQGDGFVHLMLAQCTSGLGVRGLARYQEDAERVADAAIAAAGRRFDRRRQSHRDARDGRRCAALPGHRADQRRAARRIAAGLLREFRAATHAALAVRRRTGRLGHAAAASARRERRRLAGGGCGGRRCLAARAIDRRYAHARGTAHAHRSARSCGGCSTRTTCACSSPRPCIFAAAARASALRACCRGSARPRRAPSSPSAARSRYAATSAIAPMSSTRSTSRGLFNAGASSDGGGRVH